MAHTTYQHGYVCTTRSAPVKPETMTYLNEQFRIMANKCQRNVERLGQDEGGAWKCVECNKCFRSEKELDAHKISREHKEKDPLEFKLFIAE